MSTIISDTDPVAAELCIAAADPQALKRKLGGYVRRGNHDAADETRRELKAARLAAWIRREVESSPPLTADQIEQLRGLLPYPHPSAPEGDREVIPA